MQASRKARESGLPGSCGANRTGNWGHLRCCGELYYYSTLVPDWSPGHCCVWEHPGVFKPITLNGSTALQGDPWDLPHGVSRKKSGGCDPLARSLRKWPFQRWVCPFSQSSCLIIAFGPFRDSVHQSLCFCFCPRCLVVQGHRSVSFFNSWGRSMPNRMGKQEPSCCVIIRVGTQGWGWKLHLCIPVSRSHH